MSTEFVDAPTDPSLEAGEADSALTASESGPDGPINEDAVWRLAIALSGAVTPYEVGMAIAERGLAAAGASLSNLAILNPETQKLRVVHGSVLDPGIAARWAEFHIDEHTPLSDAMKTGRPVLLATEEDIGLVYPKLLPETMASLVSATASLPLHSAEGRVIGAVGLGWRSPQRFGTTQMRRLQRITEMASQALDRALAERERGQRTAREIADASVLQEAFLPRTLPQTDRLSLSAAYLPASDAPMGGDWYDAFPVDGGLCLVVGDVGGHGLQSSAVMAQLRNAARAFAHEDPTPSRVVERLNRMLCRLEPEETATAIVAVWDESTGTITRTNAGHPPVLRCRVGETKFLLPRAGNTMLGAASDWKYSQEPKFLRPGSTLLFYTDGLIEMRGRSLDDGMRELSDFVESLSDLSPEVVCNEVLEWRLSAGGREDDICILAVGVR